MQIIIPMAGTGQRFINAGYKEPKPLIKVEGKAMIEHVIDMFPGEQDFLFICNKQHLATSPMEEILKKAKPTGRIFAIDPHKLGPVYSVILAKDLIKDNEEAIVNHCDFSVYWDYTHFLKTLEEKKPAGCITAYKGFHPHLLGNDIYASMRHDQNNYMIEIREKYSFTENKMDSYQASATYYFARGSYIKKYFQKLIDEGISVGGEYFVSSVYNLLREDGLDIYIYELEYFLQWGTPEDFEEYIYWSDYFHNKFLA